MHFLRSWRALLVREFIEHGIPFLYFPAGILTLFVLSAGSGLAYNRFRFAEDLHLGAPLKLFEVGYLALIALWLAYTGIALFFYFGDAFAADRRNNAMLFWKSMPVTDVKILSAKFLAGITLFPAIVYVMAVASGLLFILALNIAPWTFPGFSAPDLGMTLMSFIQVTLFGIIYIAVGMLWYAPFMAWVGGLSAVFGRWSLPLAFVIPGLLMAMENMIAFSQIPRGGYVWGYLSKRFQYGLSNFDWGLMAAAPVPFDARTYTWLLFRELDWMALGTGLVFTAVIVLLASEYRRRRIT